MKPALNAACAATYSPGSSRTSARGSRFMFACSLACLACAAATGLAVLYFPAAMFLTVSICFRFMGQEELLPQRPALPAGAAGPDVTQGELTGGETTPGYLASLGAATSDTPSGFTPIAFHNPMERRFATATGRWLSIASGEIIGTMRMDIHSGQRGGDAMDTIECTLQLADTTGHAWECRQIMLPFLLTDPIEPGAKLPANGFIFCADSPPSWQQALRDNCLISGVHNLLDTRDVGQLIIGGDTYRIYFRNQVPIIDVAYLTSPPSFIVRISRLRHDIHAEGELAGSKELLPFCYSLPPDELLFLASPHHYFSYHEEWYAMEGGVKKRDPLFNGLHRRESPQPLVRLLD